MATPSRWRFLVALIWIVLTPSPSLAAEPAKILVLDSAEFVLHDTQTPPPDSAAWKPQRLPDNWNLSRPQRSGFGWYRIRFALHERPDELYALYAPKVSLNAAFYVNGQYLGSGGAFPPTGLGRNANRPQFFVIAPQLLKSGSNVLDVGVWSVASAGALGGLGRVQLGPEVELRPLFEYRYLFQVQLQQISAALIGLVAVLMLFLWMRRPKDTIYAYFGASHLAEIGWIGLYVIRDAPLPGFQWDIFCLTALSCSLAFSGMFILRLVGRRWPSFEILLWLWALTTLIGLSVQGPDSYYATVAFIASIDWIFTAVFIVILADAWRQTRDADTLLVLVILVIAVMLTAYDFALLSGIAPFEWMFVAPYALAFNSVLTGGILVNRFVRNLNDFERLNVELEARVEQKHAELEDNYQRMQQLEREAAVVEERQRIMRDMHDGLGAQLISTLSLVERGDLAKEEVAAVLRECLDDLRLTIDSLESAENDLLTVLGNFRYRLEPRLASHGIKLEWQVRDVPRLACLTPRNVLHVLRILQEAFTNILKHASASVVKVETGVADQAAQVYVAVSDNGVGISGNHHGHGLDNMQRRAQSIGGTLRVASAATGTIVTLSLPGAVA